MKTLTTLAISSSLLVAAAASIPVPVLADVLTNEGVSGDIDSKRRAPVLSVGVEPRTLASGQRDGVKLLVDAFVPNEEFTRYPLRFDFFVNRQLVSTQMRSTELPGPIGIDVSRTMAATPFNYSVVATVIHPNRQYVSVLHGAVFGTDLISNLSCTLTIPGPTILESEEFESTQRGENQLVLSFKGQEQNDADENEKVAQVEAVVTLSDPSGSSEQTAGTGSVTYTVDKDIEKTVTISGDVTFTDGKVSGASLASANDSVSLECGESVDDTDDEEEGTDESDDSADPDIDASNADTAL